MTEKWLRRLRGAIGMGFAWALAWFSAGMALLLVIGPDAADVPFPLGFGLLGFLAGVTFSGVLTAVAGRRTFDQISIPRFALWGGAAGFLFGAGFVFVTAALGAASLPVLDMGVVFGLAGAGTAGGSLALARRAGGRTSLGAGGDGPEAKLADSEAEELHGGTG